VAGARSLKAVVLARGLGTRMRREEPGAPLSGAQRAAAEAGAKALFPFERPFLDYQLSALADAGCEEAVLVIGPEHREVRERYARLAPPRRIRVGFAVQAEPLGTADAVLAAEGAAGGEDFLCLNGDNHYPAACLAPLLAVEGAGAVLFDPAALVARSNIPPERIRAFAACRVEGERLVEIVEKPTPAEQAALGPGALVSMGCWRLPAAIFEDCRSVPLSARGERELTQAVARAIGRGVVFRALRSTEAVLDLSSRADIPAVAEWLRGLAVDP
jgi:glucose-1-phosphate thymidylyltransferase